MRVLVNELPPPIVHVIEQRMRPGRLSDSGFLDDSERLINVIDRDLNLLRILNRGMIPDHFIRDGYKKALKAYTQDYLKEEVFDEGLTRNIPAFSRFLMPWDIPMENRRIIRISPVTVGLMLKL